MLTVATPAPLPRLQRGSLRAASKALAAPTEAESGLTVDPDVEAETQASGQRADCADVCSHCMLPLLGAPACLTAHCSALRPAQPTNLLQRRRASCADHLRHAGCALPAGFAATSPAAAAVAATPQGAAALEAGACKAAALPGAKGPAGCDGEAGGEGGPAEGRPFAVEMFGLRKEYKVRLLLLLGC